MKPVGIGIAASLLTVAFSVWATSVGTNVSVDGTLTITGASTLNGNSTFGDAATDINLFTGTLQASTTALFTGAVTTYGNTTLGDASTDTLTVNATSTFAAGVTVNAGGLSVTAGGLTIANDGTISGGLGVGTTATTTAGAIQTSGPVQFGGIVSVSQSGTSTISINSTTASKGACIQFESASGAATFRLYATSASVAVFETGTCR